MPFLLFQCKSLSFHPTKSFFLISECNGNECRKPLATLYSTKIQELSVSSTTRSIIYHKNSKLHAFFMAQSHSHTREVDDLTRNGRSMLEGLLCIGGYTEIQEQIYSHFNNDEIVPVIISSRTLYDNLIAAGTRPDGIVPNNFCQRHLVDKCSERSVPGPGGRGPATCPNGPNSAAIVRTCKCRNYPEFARVCAFNRLVCSSCRSHYHSGPMTWDYFADTYEGWRNIFAAAQVPVCRDCDREQHDSVDGEDGHDGCTCYETLYTRRWLCYRCSFANNTAIQNKAMRRRTAFGCRKLVQRGNKMRRRVGQRNGPGQKSLCPCPRGRPALHPLIELQPKINISVDFVGNQHLLTRNPKQNRHGVWLPPLKLKSTMQCTLCCGYVVPPKRKSERLKTKRNNQHRAQHIMLGRKGERLGGDSINDHGFSKE